MADLSVVSHNFNVNFVNFNKLKFTKHPLSQRALLRLFD